MSLFTLSRPIILYNFTKYVFKDSDNINIIENGSTKQARFSFASFEFVGDNSGQLYAHCNVNLCDPNNETCEPSCGAGRRR